ncbi:UDP-phosphate glucose phosphotransferase [Candidatus Omnitrophus magneticus]|uniref:UDP-phosphate glucose phosphotransferase n=1 Tax=Candidatus Omnitrophus magneticus TaxID=1609969 RepID=A0A0F0CTB3_9BACT|nr:UDP-phosphate glucose phosphotransferase [Candidatus Omnitrophus magneticus]
MKIRNHMIIRFILLTGDIIAINLGFLSAYWLRFNSGILESPHGVPDAGQYIQILPILTLVFIFLMRGEKLYSIKSRLSIVDEFFLIIRAVTITIFILMAGTFVYREFSFSRGTLSISWLIIIIFINAWRFLINKIRFFIRKHFGKTRNLVIAGDDAIVERLITHIANDPHWDYNVIGVLRITTISSGTVNGIPVLGKLENFKNIFFKKKIDELIVTDLEIPRQKMIEILMECEKKLIEFRVVADLLGMMTSAVDMRTIDGIPLLGLKESPLHEGFNRFLKRMMDITFSLAGLIILSPLFLIIAVIIKLDSLGPIFYRQKRIGEDGTRFAMIKFRTMINNAEKGTGRVWTKKDDPRRTRTGAFLRRYNLDELPQLINVFIGDMSLVGPRPERPHFVEKFKQSVPRYMARHKIKSGMTGWAQVNGLRGNTSIEERTKYDLYYIENWSISFDIKILCMSIFALKNAY